MYICKECGKVFEEPCVEHDDPSPQGVGLASGYYTYTYCPHCGSDEFTEADLCLCCGDYIPSGDVLCKDCRADVAQTLTELKESMKLNQDDFEEAVAQYFGW